MSLGVDWDVPCMRIIEDYYENHPCSVEMVKDAKAELMGLVF